MKGSITKTGKRVNLYLRDTDVAKMRELNAYAAGQGIRTSDSLIVRATLLATTPGKGFLTALREAAAVDLRFKQE
jgi:hypothetical protein